jgi:cytochrome c oxidase cbb3-type subunit 4
VSNLKEYFHTEWAAMTLNDWIGLIVTVGITLLMVWAYVYVFHPKNKETFESQRYLPDDDEDSSNDAEEKK